MKKQREPKQSLSDWLLNLRSKTKPYHDQIEANALLCKLQGDLNRDSFVAILAKFYGFYQPIETGLVPRFLDKTPHLSKFFFPKLPLLEADLCGFSVPRVPLCKRLPPIETPHQLLGLLYTLEGSCMGRRFLWPKIQRALNCESAFFADAKGSPWKAFLENLDHEITDNQQEEELVSGSISTFVYLDQWFSEDAA